MNQSWKNTENEKSANLEDRILDVGSSDTTDQAKEFLSSELATAKRQHKISQFRLILIIVILLNILLSSGLNLMTSAFISLLQLVILIGISVANKDYSLIRMYNDIVKFIKK